MFERLSWVAVICLCAAALQAGEPVVEKPAVEKVPAQTLEDRVTALEKQVQMLMQAMVEKDNRIAELQRQLGEVEQRRPGLPTLQFRGTPREMENMWRNWQRDFFRDDPAEEEDFLGPWRRNPPLQRDWPRPAPRSKPRLGVTLAEPTPQLAERYRNESKTGAFVTQVLPDSAAQKAGILEGDCITAFDERPVIEVQELIRLIQAATPGKHMLTLKRRGEDLKLPIRLGEQGDQTGRQLPGPMQRLEKGWLKRDPAGLHEVLVVRSSALEVTPQLAAEMMLTGPQREVMVKVLKKHAEQVSEEYAVKGGAGGGVATNNAILEPLIDRHVAAAEAELKGVLDQKQLEVWRTYRAKNKRLSVSRSLKMQGQREPEGLDF